MGYPRLLSPEARDALDRVQTARARQRAERERAQVLADRLIADLTRDAEVELAHAVKAAIDLKVPHTRVGKEGLGTTDWLTVDAYVEQAEAEAASAAA
jgi:hypothetical protein